MASKSWQIKYAEFVLSRVKKGDKLFDSIVDNHGKLQMLLTIEMMVFTGKFMQCLDLNQDLISGFCKNWSTKCLVKDQELLAKTLLLSLILTMKLESTPSARRASLLDSLISSSIQDYSRAYMKYAIEKCLGTPPDEM